VPLQAAKKAPQQGKSKATQAAKKAQAASKGGKAKKKVEFSFVLCSSPDSLLM
jgi:hypothetical protein